MEFVDTSSLSFPHLTLAVLQGGLITIALAGNDLVLSWSCLFLSVNAIVLTLLVTMYGIQFVLSVS